MTLQIEDIKAEIERSLKVLSEQRGDEIPIRIRSILYTNLDRGRMQDFLEGEIDRVRDYVWRVADKYVSLSPYVNSLQNEGSTTAWEPLIIQLQKWAYHFLSNDIVDTPPMENAQECANESAATILGAYFPYDTDFEPWAHVVVKNVCSKFVRKAMKKSSVPQQSIIHIDDILDTLKDPQFEQQERQKDLQDRLFEAIAQLSDGRRQVIELKYLEEYSLEEISQKMGKSANAIYCLHFRALEDLRKILSKNEDSLNG
jgi:RNA polymerase sigma factor (sigma-70 family)